MKRDLLNVGFMALVDCAPLVVAKELGFAGGEGIELVLHRQPSWSAIRDKLVFGELDAAHMLSVLPVAMALGLGGAVARIDALSVMSVNGDVVGASPLLAGRMQSIGIQRGLDQATAVGQCLIEASRGKLRIGVPFPFSMHVELLQHWLTALGASERVDLDIRTVPPPQMADAMAADEIDAFCVGEPWGSIAVDAGTAEIILPGAAIWNFAPEKVLSVRHDWAEQHGDLAARLVRAMWRSARWLGDAENRLNVSDLLGRSEYLNMDPEIIDRSLSGRLVMAQNAAPVAIQDIIEFEDRAATFPWRSQAMWIASRWADRQGIDRKRALVAAAACYRADLYRAALSEVGADLPGASSKLEGALTHRTAVASSSGEMFLGPDRFFDGSTFDPDA